VSCSVHDLVRLERRGIATAGVGTKPFVDEALLQARALGMPDLRMTFVRHPIQLLSTNELHARADDSFPKVVDLLVAGGTTNDGTRS
jgi:hypothetical protein